MAHPGEITSIAVSHDGKYVFSAGGNDLTVNQWSLFEEYPDLNENEANSLMSFLQLLDGGPFGELHQNFIDYFYYCQLRHGGEDTLDTRRLTGRSCLLNDSHRCSSFFLRQDSSGGNSGADEICWLLSVGRGSTQYD